jgi:hypothetical protein
MVIAFSKLRSLGAEVTRGSNDVDDPNSVDLQAAERLGCIGGGKTRLGAASADSAISRVLLRNMRLVWRHLIEFGRPQVSAASYQRGRELKL